ncbi:potassium-transporting ATPase subunit KdpA [Yinghuangia sp. ASG 101]|uniref:potassium-transporting ATPase subunit KdpA n=1 Tax=Yinghuangia sp. ASG 101 TaxID=2896848 RepID=UPI001E4B3761|nr:potassium-transporting ATPase subunit KdpA [Yinghuangia sp. ASG 101]UGQ13455.1 potassium-transporting ATPase subunit KdpA [Yinghuangia sp. ASG 101]
MSAGVAGILQAILLIAVLAAVHRPFGDYMAGVYTSDRHLRVERWIYRAVGADPDSGQRWGIYLRSVLAFSMFSLLGLYALLRLQNHLPWSLGFAPMKPDQAFNTAASFTANTNWQSYSGESAVGHTVQMAGLTVQNFVSAAVGMAVAVALVRGFVRVRSGEIGNFWVDLVRGSLRILLPIAVVGTIVLVASGTIQNLAYPHTVTTLNGGTQTITGGPVASQEVIKELGTNGGGFYNANSAHPFENPNAFTNLFEIFLILVIPFSMPRTFGTMVGSVKQGYAILGAMFALWFVAVVLMTWAEMHHGGTAPELAGGATEGKEQRFGIPGSSLFATSTTMTSTGAVNSFHSSYTGLGGGITLLGMMLGEVSPGGVGSGLYGMLIMAVLAVFVAGLMVGRTPEYLGKKIGAGEMKLVALSILVVPATILTMTGIALALPGERASILNADSPHGLTEVLYAYTSGANNNGSAFAGLSANTEYYNTTIGFAMLIGRFFTIALVLALAGRLAEQRRVPESAGTLKTHRPLFAGTLVGVIVIVTGLTFFPSLALGPLAEGLA